MAPILGTIGKYASSIVQTVQNHWITTLIKSLKLLKTLLYNICQINDIFWGVGVILIITSLIGTTVSDPFWDTIRDQILGKPSEEIKECHKPKPVLIHTGEVKFFLLLFFFMMKLVYCFLKFRNCQIWVVELYWHERSYLDLPTSKYLILKV